MRACILSALIGYAIGSVNLSIIISRFRGGDIRTVGSGNAGATNALRTMGAATAAAVLLFDIIKGMIAALAAYSIFKDVLAQYVAALAAVVGHVFPIWHSLRGGKGVAAGFGALLYLDFRVALAAAAVFLVVTLIWRYVSLGSVCAAASAPLAAYALNGFGALFAVALIIAIVIIARHRSNIVRLVHHEENAIGAKKDKPQLDGAGKERDAK